MSEDGHGVSSGMRAKGDWGCRPFPLMQSPSPCPAGRHNATATDLNPRYNSLHRSYPRLSPSGSSFDWKRGFSRARRFFAVWWEIYQGPARRGRGSFSAYALAYARATEGLRRADENRRLSVGRKQVVVGLVTACFSPRQEDKWELPRRLPLWYRLRCEGKLFPSTQGSWVVRVREHSPDRNFALLTPLSRSRVDNSFFRCVAITIGIRACTLHALRHLLPPYGVVSSWEGVRDKFVTLRRLGRESPSSRRSGC